jgi:hypothetical protein
LPKNTSVQYEFDYVKHPEKSQYTLKVIGAFALGIFGSNALCAVFYAFFASYESIVYIVPFYFRSVALGCLRSCWISALSMLREHVLPRVVDTYTRGWGKGVRRCILAFPLDAFAKVRIFISRHKRMLRWLHLLIRTLTLRYTCKKIILQLFVFLVAKKAVYQ